jgi:type II restriction enzyme
MKCIEMLNKKDFTLQEMYNFENILKQKYPNNNFIKDKIRQQLQFLRNK